MVVNNILSMTNFSMVVSGAAAVTYLLDTHGPDALHVLALSNFSKNIVLYGFTFFANGMVVNRGVKVSLLILAACQAFCWLASFPMYVYGKRVRSFVRRTLFPTVVFSLTRRRLCGIRNYLWLARMTRCGPAGGHSAHDCEMVVSPRCICILTPLIHWNELSQQ